MTIKRILWYQPVPTPRDASPTERFAVWGRNFFALPSEHRYTTIALRILACVVIIPPLAALVGRIIYACRKEEAVTPKTPVGRRGIPKPRADTVYKPPRPGQQRVRLQILSSDQPPALQNRGAPQDFVPVPLPPSTPQPLRFGGSSSSDDEDGSGSDVDSLGLRLSSSDDES